MLVPRYLSLLPPQQEQQQAEDLGHKLMLAFLTGIATAAGAAFFNAITRPQRRRC